MNPQFITGYLFVEAHEHPQGVLMDEMRIYARKRLALIDWAIVGDDIPWSIVRVPLLDEYAPDRIAFPHWPWRAF
ncbi:hypothetical protein [Bradyrhizobium denitrificans]|uniref:hypothetical protein n=1 Tax=Bradyrhizobium denitrificans TaxID=2734912 RepID=UPI001552D812|nr:hypothetical protein [Bradyrhizobium sp. LMG 8443]NPU25719.1 hypothetical protein [Bradyrhizobium sp. LMG 8443]